MAHILIVDDDKNICQLLELYLANEGYSLTFVHDGSMALDMIKKEDIDLVVLDIMLPVINGWEVCKMIRRESMVPIIMLTARDLVEDKIQGFELGADDYIIKPFEPREVVARIKARLKNRAISENKDKFGSSISKNILKAGNLEVDIDRYETRINGQKIDFKPKEIQLLYFLLRNKNMVFSREQLLERVWDYTFEGDTRTVDVHINRLREKMEGACTACHIRTVWGVGYKLESDV
ncbi:MAG: response regulator transcription factor [Peptococcaceae bacterium]|nr:response regulator transcription factor [Peptococcaceae bacterium]